MDRMPRIKAIIFAVVGLALVWQIATKSLVAYLATAAPELARWIDPTHPGVLLALADNALRAAQLARAAQSQGAEGAQAAADRFIFSSQLDQSAAGAVATDRDGKRAPTISRPIIDPDLSRDIKTWAEQAVLRQPLNAPALRILGQLADDARDSQRAMLSMRAAARLSIRESPAVFWMMTKSVELQDHAATFYYADALARSRPLLQPYVLPVLTALAEHNIGSGLVKSELAKRPPWRPAFFAALPGSARDIRTPLDIMLALKQGPSPPTPNEYRPYLDTLIARQQYELAYYAWLQFLPPDHLASTGFLFNGNFRLQPSDLPFDWVIQDGRGASVEVAPVPGEQGQSALVVEFGVGRVEFPGVSQLVMLGPGSYRLKGRYRGELSGPRGLRWRVTCANGQIMIGDGAMLLGTVPNWREFDVTFTVPPTGCRAQYVRLGLDARSASEQLVTGRMWFGEMTLARAAPTPRR